MGGNLALDQEEITRQLFQDAMTTWSGRDLEGALAYMRDDVAHVHLSLIHI